jgi:glycosyltransferase involved in cell wall biosynthesis
VIAVRADQMLDELWVATIPPGLPSSLLTPRSCRQKYVAFLGRISPEKGVAKAIRIAGKAGLKLLIVAKIAA